MRRLALAAVSAAALLLSCSRERCLQESAAPPSADESHGPEISFLAEDCEDVRAGQIRILPDFGVFAVGSVGGGEVMCDQMVIRAPGGYTYSPTKYFPTEGMDVISYSPYGCASVSFSGGPGLVTDVNVSLPESLTDDILIAGPVRGITHAPIHLVFRHLLTSISASFTFSLEGGEIPSGKGVRVVSIGLTHCIRKGTYDAQNDVWKPSAIVSRSFRSVSIPASEGTEVGLGTLYTIPFTAPDGAKLRLVWESYKLSSGVTTRRNTVEADLSGRNLAISKNLNVRVGAAWLEDTISFEDPETESVCLAAFDADGDGVLSYYEAECVTDLGDVFRGNDRIVKFNEFVHFTGIASLQGRESGPFASMSSLKEITLPPSLSEAGEWPFAHCPSLESISVDPANPVYYSVDGCLFARNPSAIVRVPESLGPDPYVIPSGISSIGYGCFADNTVIRQLRIGKDVSSIGDEALRIKFLESVSVDPDSEFYIVSGSALYRKSLGLRTELVLLPPFCGVRTLSLPSSVRRVRAYAVLRNFPLSTVVLNEGLESIGDCAFNTKISSLTVKAATPPVLGNNVFLPESDYDYTPFPIYVPSSSVSLYRTAPGWSALSSRIQPIQ